MWVNRRVAGGIKDPNIECPFPDKRSYYVRIILLCFKQLYPPSSPCVARLLEQFTNFKARVDKSHQATGILPKVVGRVTISSMNIENDTILPSSRGSWSQVSSPLPEIATEMADEEAALRAMEDEVISGIVDVLQASISPVPKDGPKINPPPIPRKLIRQTEILVQQGREKELWGRIMEELRKFLLEAVGRVHRKEDPETGFMDCIGFANGYCKSLQRLASVLTLVSGRGVEGIQSLAKETLAECIFKSHDILEQCVQAFLIFFDRLLETGSIGGVRGESWASDFYALLDDDAFDNFFVECRSKFEERSEQLLTKHYEVNKGRLRPDRLLLDRCRLVNYWSQCLDKFWLDAVFEDTDEFEEFVESVLTDIFYCQVTVWGDLLIEAMKHNNATALSEFEKLESRYYRGLDLDFELPILYDSRYRFIEEIVTSGNWGIVSAMKLARLHTLFDRSVPKNSRLESGEPKPWLASLEVIQDDTTITLNPVTELSRMGKLGQSLARYALLELIACLRDPWYSKKGTIYFKSSCALISELDGVAKEQFIDVFFSELMTLLIPRPDHRTLVISHHLHSAIGQSLRGIEPKSAQKAMVLLSDFATSRQIGGTNVLVGSRGAWHLDYKSTKLAETEIQKAYEAAFEDRLVTISQTLSCVEIEVEGNTLFVTLVQFKVLQHLNGKTKTVENLLATLEFRRDEALNAIIDLIDAGLVAHYSKSPATTLDQEDILSLHSSPPRSGSKFMFKLRTFDDDYMEDD